MMLDAAGLSSQSRTRVRTGLQRNPEQQLIFRSQAALVPPFLLDRRRLANPGGETLAVPRRQSAELNERARKTTNAARINDKMMATRILTL